MIEIDNENNSRYRFFLKTKDGSTLLQSVYFTSIAEVEKTIESLNDIIKHPVVFERRTDHSGKFLFSLKDQAGKVIGKSQLYNSEAGMENGITHCINTVASLREKE